MRTTRLEAFSDGVLAIIITIMVLELRTPSGTTWRSLGGGVAGSFLIYLLSFVYIAIYWNNHHHLMQLNDRVTGGMLWANQALLFFLSLTPVTTSWMDKGHFASVPCVVYGIGLLLNAIAYWTLERVIVRAQGTGGLLHRAVGSDLKARISPAIYAAGIACSFFWVPGGLAAYILVALLWVLPDRRVERIVEEEGLPDDVGNSTA